MTVTPTATATVQAQADLVTALSISSTTPIYWNTVTLTAVVTNNGPIDATGVVVVMPLPAGLTFVSADSGAYASGTGAWTVGTLANGASATLKVTARVNSVSLGAQTVTATASAATLDPSLNNNAASVTETPQKATASVHIVGDPGNPPPDNVDINDPGTIGWSAVIDTNALGASLQTSLVWICEANSGTDCPFVPALNPLANSPTLSFPIQSFRVIDIYTITLILVVDQNNTNFNTDPSAVHVSFTTTNNGG